MALCAWALWLVPAATVVARQPLAVEWSKLRDLDDRPLRLADCKVKVICFLGSECPLARLYASRLNRLAAEFEPRGVRIVGINSNPQDSSADVVRYVEEHGLVFPIVKDADQSLASRLGATRTPEVFVLDEEERIAYQGRIDDQYEPGIARAEPARHDLREAIEALLAGRRVPRARTTAVGCLITFAGRPKAGSSSPTVTFTRDVAPILNRHCVECHRPGEIGPFALTEYDEVFGWGSMILEVIDQKRMPPWHADPRYGEFVGERLLPAADRETLGAWVEQGMPEGAPADLPAPPEWIAGWHLRVPPDAEFAMRDRPFIVPREGTVEYQYFVVDPKWEEDRWVRAAQVVPGNATVVHHAIVFVRPPDGAEREGIGWLGAYVPGQRTASLPPGHARRVPAGSKLVFQMHYTPTGQGAPDVTRVGVWFSDSSEVTHEVYTRFALNQDFEIPPGAEDHTVAMRLDGFSRESRLLGAMPHMHLRGKSFQLEALRGDRRETLLRVPRYDFNWQHWYQFQSPLQLDAIDAFEMRVSFDNSRGNPVNPAPDEYVTWGDQTYEEMAVAFFDVAHPRHVPRIVAGSGPAESGETAARRHRIRSRAAEFLAEMDRDGDGVVLRDEAPLTFRRFGFRSMDRNRDGRLERDEIEAAAAQRP